MMEASSGIGLLLGPFFGAVLYSIGGYVLPFVSVAALYFILYPLIAYTLAQINEAENNLSSAQKRQDTKQKENQNPELQSAEAQSEITLKYGSLFKVPRFFFGLLSQILVYASVTFLQPILALHLQQFGYDAVYIGFSFAIPTLIYAATSPLIYVMTSRIRKTGVILIGYTILAIGMFLVGPSKLLGLTNSPAFIILGLAIVGLGCGMVIIPVLPDMIEAIEQRYSNINEDELHNNISGLFIAFQGIGETLGPVLGSVLEEFYGFRTAQDIMAVSIFLFLVVYFLICGKFKAFKSMPRSPRKGGEDDNKVLFDNEEKSDNYKSHQAYERRGKNEGGSIIELQATKSQVSGSVKNQDGKHLKFTDEDESSQIPQQ